MIYSYEESKNIPKEKIGSKSFNIVNLYSKSFRVPNGFCLSVEFLENIFSKSNNSLAIFYQEAKKYSVVLNNYLNDLHGNYFVVRSSSIAEDSSDKSYAGQFKTLIGIKKENIIDAISQVYFSSLSENVKAYSLKSERIGMGILIQEIIPSTISGVMFTANILSNSLDELMIESTFGLAEPLVSGRVNPDFYLLDKSNAMIIEKELGDKKELLFWDDGLKQSISFDNEHSLNNDKLIELVKTGLLIESTYGCPQDIEWSYVNDKLYILQSRPITTLNKGDLI